jgi:3-oxoacyl-[acyl-carrier protein] reductase
MQGKRAIVTGAASGLGKATALVLAQLGASLLLTDRAPMEAVRDEIQAAGGTCLVSQGDLTDDAFIAGLFGTERVYALASWRDGPGRRTAPGTSDFTG